MKNLITLMLLFCCTSLFSQAPQSFSYQAVARDISGSPLPNQAVALRISILSGSVSGNIDYQETHNSTTNQLGLMTLSIGTGTPQIGTFSAIDWGGNTYFIMVEMDITGGTNYQVFGTSQLLSVPYALYSEKAGNGSQWENNNTGIYYNQGTVSINTNSVPNPDIFFNVHTNRGAAFEFMLNNTPATDHYPTFRMVDSSRAVSTSIRLLDYLNNEPTMEFGYSVAQGSARHFNFRTNGTDVFSILGSGKIGVGINAPASKLHVKSGDVYVDDIASGVILTSPNGNCWRVTVDNSGNLVRTAISCP